MIFLSILCILRAVGKLFVTFFEMLLSALTWLISSWLGLIGRIFIQDSLKRTVLCHSIRASTMM